MDGDVIDISIIQNIGNIHKLTVDMIKPFLSKDNKTFTDKNGKLRMSEIDKNHCDKDRKEIPNGYRYWN